MPRTPTFRRLFKKAEEPNGPVYAYVFTYNNYTKDGEEMLKNWLKSNTKYAVFGHEIGKKKKTPHLQGYMNLTTKLRTNTIQNRLKKLGVKLALKYAFGTPEQCRTYCIKDEDDIFECGDISKCGQGTRTDLNDKCKDLMDGKITVADIARETPTLYLQYGRRFEELVELVYHPKVINTIKQDFEVEWHYGPGGCGKSGYCFKKYGESNVHQVMYDKDKTWYDGYMGQPALLLDDIVKNYKYKGLLNLMNNRINRVNIKTRTGLALFNKIIICDTYPPWMVYPKSYDYQLARRITKLYKWRGVWPKGEYMLIDHKDSNGNFATNEFFHERPDRPLGYSFTSEWIKDDPSQWGEQSDEESEDPDAVAREEMEIQEIMRQTEELRREREEAQKLLDDRQLQVLEYNNPEENM